MGLAWAATPCDLQEGASPRIVRGVPREIWWEVVGGPRAGGTFRILSPHGEVPYASTPGGVNADQEPLTLVRARTPLRPFTRYRIGCLDQEDRHRSRPEVIWTGGRLRVPLTTGVRRLVSAELLFGTIEAERRRSFRLLSLIFESEGRKGPMPAVASAWILRDGEPEAARPTRPADAEGHLDLNGALTTSTRVFLPPDLPPQARMLVAVRTVSGDWLDGVFVVAVDTERRRATVETQGPSGAPDGLRVVPANPDAPVASRFLGLVHAQPGAVGSGQVDLALLVRPRAESAELVVAGWRGPDRPDVRQRPPDAVLAVSLGASRVVPVSMPFNGATEVEPPLWIGVRDASGAWGETLVNVTVGPLGWRVTDSPQACLRDLSDAIEWRKGQPFHPILQARARAAQHQACD